MIGVIVFRTMNNLFERYCYRRGIALMARREGELCEAERVDPRPSGSEGNSNPRKINDLRDSHRCRAAYGTALNA
jgi:hypothetical protein